MTSGLRADIEEAIRFNDAFNKEGADRNAILKEYLRNQENRAKKPAKEVRKILFRILFENFEYCREELARAQAHLRVAEDFIRELSDICACPPEH